MGTLIGVGALVALVIGGLVYVLIAGRKSGAAEANVKTSQEAADAAQRMADAEAAGPHDRDAVTDRLRKSGF